jgi:hypothetical protein
MEQKLRFELVLGLLAILKKRFGLIATFDGGFYMFWQKE